LRQKPYAKLHVKAVVVLADSPHSTSNT